MSKEGRIHFFRVNFIFSTAGATTYYSGPTYIPTYSIVWPDGFISFQYLVIKNNEKLPNSNRHLPKLALNIPDHYIKRQKISKHL